MLDRFAKWWSDLDAVIVLRGLDDRMLEDMGVTREEIRSRVRGPEEDAPGRRREAGPWIGARRAR